ncbi:hypothetical protein [Bradyrhizobium sp. ARR65]|uniref:hypothetical protein n=1 Tax=Bradyrhizobium sp. ARR65 TaxID=1040989 RepID=UPI0005583705|nr:hypothetical protein [Bradyrhizobium sp. ARR65]
MLKNHLMGRRLPDVQDRPSRQVYRLDQLGFHDLPSATSLTIWRCSAVDSVTQKSFGSIGIVFELLNQRDQIV